MHKSSMPSRKCLLLSRRLQRVMPCRAQICLDLYSCSRADAAQPTQRVCRQLTAVVLLLQLLHSSQCRGSWGLQQACTRRLSSMLGQVSLAPSNQLSSGATQQQDVVEVEPKFICYCCAVQLVLALLAITGVFLLVPRGISVGTIEVHSTKMTFNSTTKTYRIILQAEVPIFNPNYLQVGVCDG